ncbi:MAG: hypothetical protein H7096_04000 [Flavobacterium sp.]|nr:hypothetical protein [Pedobacter sp.]
MKGIKKPFGISISIGLLLFFSVTVLPLDFLHNHASEQRVCKEAQTNKPCHHSFHLSTTKSFCWICAIHFDTHFTTTEVYEKINDLPVVRIFAENEVTGYFLKCLLPTLRGPPQAD